MEHIDRQKLYTDLMYRFQYVSKFIGFGEEDIAAIKGAAGFVGPLVPTIVDTVYKKLFSFDITKVNEVTGSFITCSGILLEEKRRILWTH